MLGCMLLLVQGAPDPSHACFGPASARPIAFMHRKQSTDPKNMISCVNVTNHFFSTRYFKSQFTVSATANFNVCRVIVAVGSRTFHALHIIFL